MFVLLITVIILAYVHDAIGSGQGHGVDHLEAYLSHPEHFGRFVCSLSPLEYGYYLGVNSVTYEQAQNCCLFKNLTLLSSSSLDNVTVRTRLRNALLVTSSMNGREPIGRSTSLFISPGTKPLSGKACKHLHLSSIKTPTIKLETNPDCQRFRRRFLCETQPLQLDDCSRIEYLPLDIPAEKKKFVYGKTPVPWRTALHCCEQRGQILLRLRPWLESHLLPALKDNLAPFWTNGFKNAALLETPNFQWLNGDQFLTHSSRAVGHRTEFCIAADLKTSGTNFTTALVDFPCESRLNFICYNGWTKCHDGLEWETLHVPGSVRVFSMSKGAMMSWEDAQACCKKRGNERLLSVIEPSEGDALAYALHSQHSTGLSVGVWLGAKMVTPNKYTFVELKDSPDHIIDSERYTKSRFVRGEGDCLTFIVDGRMSYITHNVPCNVERAFICEEMPQWIEFDQIFVEIGARYMYSRVPLKHDKANHTCWEHGMRLFQMQDKDESEIIALGIAPFGNHSNLLHGFWSGHKPLIIPIHAHGHFQQLPKKHSSGVDRSLAKLYQGSELLHDPICNFAFWTKSHGRMEMKQWKWNCNREAHFLCEIEPFEYGGCNLPSEQAIGNLWISQSIATWYEARDCCGKFRSGHFELVSLDHALVTSAHDPDYTDPTDEQRLFSESDIFQQFTGIGLGFWSAGTNHFSHKHRFAWLSGKYSFVAQDIFYHQYMQPNDSLHERDQCLEMVYDPHLEAVRLSHDDCLKRKQFACRRKSKHLPMLPSCDKIIYQRMGKSSFFFGWDAMPWVRAAECCHNRDAVLSKIRSSTQSRYLNKIIRGWPDGGFFDRPNHGIWIGLTKNKITGQFTWVDDFGGSKELNNSLDYHNFQTASDGLHHAPPKKVDSDDEDEASNLEEGDKSDIGCVAVFISKGELEWRVLPCSLHLRSICFDWNDVEDNENL